MKRIELHSRVPETGEAEDERFVGKFASDDDFDTLLDEACDVYKPNGDLLCSYRPGSIDKGLITERLFKTLERISAPSDNRGAAIGIKKARRRRSDGTLGQSAVDRNTFGLFYSSIFGYMDRSTRLPGCRQTAIASNNISAWAEIDPLIKRCAEQFMLSAPQSYADQMRFVEKVNPEFIIKGTPYSTLTINRNFRTAYHRDAGDVCGPGLGLSNITAVWRGRHGSGAHLVFPAFRVAVRLRTGDFLAMDAHEIHGNTPIPGVPGAFDRFSVVLYVRERLNECGTADEERKRIDAAMTSRISKKVGNV